MRILFWSLIFLVIALHGYASAAVTDFDTQEHGGIAAQDSVSTVHRAAV